MTDIKAIVRRYPEAVVSTGDVDAMDEFVAVDAIDHNVGRGGQQGLAGFKAHLAAVRQTYADFRVTVEAQYAEGDTVITRITARGMHAQAWLGIPASGREITLTGKNIDRVVNGKIVEHWGEANTIGALFQMGAKIVPNHE
jgi:steroid delta-isomerase-like uncharacterized protein